MLSSTHSLLGMCYTVVKVYTHCKLPEKDKHVYYEDLPCDVAKNYGMMCSFTSSNSPHYPVLPGKVHTDSQLYCVQCTNIRTYYGT